MKTIRVLIVDDIKNTRESIRRILNFEPQIEVVGEAGCGSEAIRLTEKLKPDIALIDISMPDMDGIQTTELLAFRVPETSVIIMSVQSETDYMKKAMMAGAREYIVKPFSGNELISTILKVYKMESRKKELIGGPAVSRTAEKADTKIISFFSTKGGVGKTTIAVNLAVELAAQKKFKVLLIDLNLQFGDIASFLNLVPKRTIADLSQAKSLKFEEIRFHILTHHSGVEVLTAPTRPEYAELVAPEHIQQILQEVKSHYDFVICDNVSRFDDISLVSLDMADEIWLVVGTDIPAIKNSKLSLEILESLNYAQKVKIVLNRFDKKMGINLKDVEKSLDYRVSFEIPSDEQLLVSALNKGIPFVEVFPRSKAAEAIRLMTGKLTQPKEENPLIVKEKPRIPTLQKIFGFGR